ncbi:chitinase-3-like protein 1 [Clytia hemisphaerica]|uniref:GH18 domain-containing protein n=1 Tax=Clytia hemisphaerica TaxID=252671 RepID=A0A7M5XC42_9CNID|eukprot:TCONS_00003721-protein
MDDGKTGKGFVKRHGKLLKGLLFTSLGIVIIMLIITLTIWVILPSFLTSEKTGVSPNKTICFYANWAQYRKNEGRFLPENIDPSLCTHITYAHLKVDLNTHALVQRQPNDDLLLAQIVALKEVNPELKVIISVGGWNHEKEPRFSNMVRNQTTRGIFIQSSISYILQHRLDGISIDWEYPTHRGTSGPEDKHRYTLLLREFREAFTLQQLPFTLSASVSAGRRVISSAYEIPEIEQYVHWVNIMAYALHGAWEDETGHHTAMTGGLPNVPDSIEAWRELGMPDDKINVGVATYGRTYKLLFKEEFDIGGPVLGAGNAGTYTKGAGILSYYEICALNWTHRTPYWESVAGKPYASDKDQWVGYETPESIASEIRTLFSDRCYHGIAVWNLGYDDFNGTFCGQGKFPLLKSAVKTLHESRSCKVTQSNASVP